MLFLSKRNEGSLKMKVFAAAMMLAVCGGTFASVTKQSIGKLDGQLVDEFTLKNQRGMSARIMTWGATIRTLSVPDRKGAFDDVVCGFDKLEDYPTKSPFFGTIAGRYANRIAKGQFSLNGKVYHLAINSGGNTLHGGIKGFDKHHWRAQILHRGAEPAVQFVYVSKDGEEGFPGKLTASVTYKVTKANSLRIDYAITTDKPTVANLTNHSYFNLAGNSGTNNLDHVLTLFASRFTPVDKTLIPTGELKSVDGTPFDFRQPTPIGARIDETEEQLQYGGGYDHNWVIDGAAGKLRIAANVFEPHSGRTMEVWTTEPGIQFYAANFMDGSLIGKGGKAYGKRYAICLETQHFPDTPNHPEFPTTTVLPGKVYRTTTIYKFGAR